MHSSLEKNEHQHHIQQQKLILLVAAGVCGGVVVSVFYVGCELRVTRCLRAMIVWLLPCALLSREERAPVSYTYSYNIQGSPPGCG